MVENKIDLKDLLEGLKQEPALDKDKSISDARIDPREELSPPARALVQVNSDNPDDDRIIGTLDNIVLVSGKAKARKSFLIGMLIVALATVETKNKLRGCLPSHKRKGIYIDTEQSKYHVQLAYKRICKMAGVRYLDNIDILAFRKHTPAERLLLLEHLVYNTPNLGFVVIDGIKDLITSINDEDQSTMIASRLMKWSEELSITIIVVLHQNKSDQNARGHIGTELVNKCETHLSVTKSDADSEISIVEAQGCRNREPESFAFEIVDNLPSLVEDFEVRTCKTPSKINFQDLEDFKVFSMLNEAFVLSSEYSYSELQIQLKMLFKDNFSKSIGTNKVKELITYCKNKKWIAQAGFKKPYTLGEYDTNNNASV